MSADELEAARAAAAATLARYESGSADMWAVRHARDVLALVECVSALRDVLTSTQRERDEARANALDARPEVIAFARLMETKLRENEHKGGWKDEFPSDLLARVGEELEELRNAVRAHTRERAHGSPSGAARLARDVGREGADVGNMVMMVLDVCGALGGEGSR